MTTRTKMIVTGLVIASAGFPLAAVQITGGQHLLAAVSATCGFVALACAIAWVRS